MLSIEQYKLALWYHITQEELNLRDQSQMGGPKTHKKLTAAANIVLHPLKDLTVPWLRITAVEKAWSSNGISNRAKLPQLSTWFGAATCTQPDTEQSYSSSSINKKCFSPKQKGHVARRSLVHLLCCQLTGYHLPNLNGHVLEVGAVIFFSCMVLVILWWALMHIYDPFPKTVEHYSKIHGCCSIDYFTPLALTMFKFNHKQNLLCSDSGMHKVGQVEHPYLSINFSHVNPCFSSSNAHW